MVRAYRIHYFLRRSIATLYEFRRPLKRLTADQEYLDAQKNDLTDLERTFFAHVDSAKLFFEEKFDVIRKFRNGVGGHFDEKAVEFATTHLDAGIASSLEMTISSDGVGFKLLYAGEIAAVRFNQSLVGNKAHGEELEEVITMVNDAHRHLALAMQSLAHLFLWERFGL